MANEQILSQLSTATDIISSAIGPELAENTIGMNLTAIQEFPRDTNTIKWRKDDYLTAEIVAEAGSMATATNKEWTETSVTCTATKMVTANNPTVESMRFGAGRVDPSIVTAKGASAIARLFDTTMFDLVSTITNTITAASIMTLDDLSDAQLEVAEDLYHKGSGVLAWLAPPKHINDVRKEIINSAASVWSNESQLQILNGMSPRNNNYKGMLLGMPVYETSLLETSGADTLGVIFDPSITFATGLGGGVQVSLEDTPNDSNGFTVEFGFWMFAKTILWHEESACQVIADS